jgi:HEAT repeat protein
LIQTLGHRDAQVRRQAALVLARIGPDAADAVPELTALLDDPEQGVRKAAARALGQIGPAAADAVPALMRQLVQPKPAMPRR